MCVCVGGGGKWHRRWKVNWIVPPEADKLLSFDCCWPPEMAVNSCLILPPQLPFFFSFRFSFSRLLSSSLFPFLSVHPPSPLCTPACLFMCWEGCDWGVGGGVVTGVWPETTIPYTLALMLTNSSMHENTQKCVHTQHTYDPHVHLLPSRGWFTGMSVCVSEQGNKGVTIWTKRKGLCVCMRGCEGRLCTSVCVCVRVWVGVCWASCSSPPHLSKVTGKHRPVCLCLFPFELLSFEPPFRPSYIIAQQPTLAPQ